MDRLSLTQTAMKEAGVSFTGPSTTIGATGLDDMFVGWVDQAYRHVLAMCPAWKFMWATHSFDTIAGKRDYNDSEMALTNGRQSVDEESFKIYLKADGQTEEGWLPFLKYKDWRRTYGAGLNDNNQPGFATILPSWEVRLEPTPDDIYTVTFEYYRDLFTFGEDDSEEPIFPSAYHDIIWAKAVMLAAEDHGAVEKFNKARKVFNAMKSRMMANLKPRIRFGHEAIDNA